MDSGGAISDVIEDWTAMLVEQWTKLGYGGFAIEDNEESDHYGDLRLPDGRHVVAMLSVEIQGEPSK